MLQAMFQALLSALPIALGTVLATLPLIAIPLVLVTRPDRAVLHAFLAGWLSGFVALGGAAIAFADILRPYGEPAETGLELLRIALGLGLIVLAWRKWRGRPLPGSDPETPGWMRRFDAIRPAGAALIGAALATLNPKNAVLVISGALAIAAATPVPAAQAGALVVHALLASAGLLAPLAAVALAGDRARSALDRLRAATARHNATVMAALFLVLGLVIILGAVGPG